MVHKQKETPTGGVSFIEIFQLGLAEYGIHLRCDLWLGNCTDQHLGNLTILEDQQTGNAAFNEVVKFPQMVIIGDGDEIGAVAFSERDAALPSSSAISTARLEKRVLVLNTESNCPTQVWEDDRVVAEAHIERPAEP